MGVHPNIAFGRFPKQGDMLGGRTRVCFHYDSSRCVEGTIVRDDAEAPWVVIIQLDDGPLVLATECQYTPVFDRPHPGRTPTSEETGGR